MQCNAQVRRTRSLHVARIAQRMCAGGNNVSEKFLVGIVVVAGEPTTYQSGVLAMNTDRIAGQWKQLNGKIKQQWGKLTDDDLKRAEGSSEYLAGKIQERYGVARDIADKQVREFQKTM